MNYRHVYTLIIEHAKLEMKRGLRPHNPYDYYKRFNTSYYEFHHILPRALYPLWKKSKRNIVALTAREHFFCHQLLCKVYPCDATYAAIVRLAHSNAKRKNSYKITSKEYERISTINAELCRKRMLGKKKNPEAVLKSAETRRGSKRTAESRKRMSDAQKEYFKNHEHPRGMKNKKQSDSFYKKRHVKQVLCIETNEIFISIGKAAEARNASHINGIYESIRKGRAYKGLHYKYI